MIVSNGNAVGFAPQALGETTPNLSNGYFYARDGMGLLNRFATYAGLYRAQPAIATLVDKVANSAARLGVKVWDVTPQTGRVQDTTSSYAQLIRNPCAVLGPYQFWRWVFSTYEIYGEAFLYKLRNEAGQIITLLPMHPSRTAVRRDAAGNVEYVFTLGVASAGILTAGEDDVIPFLRYNPDELMRGLSRLEPLRTTMINEDAARQANQAFWTNGARPSVVLEHPKTLEQTAVERLRAAFNARNAGVQAAGAVAVLQEGMKANVVQLNAEEMQYIASRQMNREEACMVYDVPPPVVHILDHATFSNITEQMRSMYRDTMAPRLGDVESVLDNYLRAEYFAAGQRDTEFDMTDVLRGDFETRADKAVSLRTGGIFTGNQALELVGLPRSDDPEMDKVYANAALVPLGLAQTRVTVAEAATPPTSLTADATAAANQATAADEQALESSKRLTVRTVMGRLARTKQTKADIRANLVDQHEAELRKFFDRQKAFTKQALTTKSVSLDSFDGDLATILHTLSTATAAAIGAKVAADLGGTYTAADIEDYLKSNAEDVAKRINATTTDEIAKAIEAQADDDDDDDTVDDLFDGQVAARAHQISVSRVATIAGLAALVAARQSSAKTKTWVTGGNPRELHSEMDGETVPLGEPFSNGMSGPGDYSGGADEVANCNCDLDFSMEEAS